MPLEYAIYAKSGDATAATAKEAKDRGCDGIGTIYWWATRPTLDGKTALVIPDVDQVAAALKLGVVLLTDAQVTFPTPVSLPVPTPTPVGIPTVAVA